ATRRVPGVEDAMDTGNDRYPEPRKQPEHEPWTRAVAHHGHVRAERDDRHERSHAFPELPEVVTQAPLVCPPVGAVHDADATRRERTARIACEPGCHHQRLGVQSGADVEELLR